jgi:hypothetical protein
MAKHTFFLGLILSLLTINYAWAQEFSNGEPTQLPEIRYDVKPEADFLPNVKLHTKTHPEKIVFSQIKLADGEADIDDFSKQSPFVKQAQDIDKSAMIISEYNRIANTYNLYDPESEIVVHTIVRADEYSNMQNIIVFDEFDEKTFFRFSMYGYNVGIVPENIADFSTLEISPERAQRMFSQIDPNGKVLAEFILKPTYADIREPFAFNNQNYWLMSARIAEFRIWSHSDPEKAMLLWYHRAPWYSPVNETNLEDLYTLEENM